MNGILQRADAVIFRSIKANMQAGRMKARTDFWEQDSTFASYTSNMGYYYEQMGDYEQALSFYTQAKDIFKVVLGSSHTDFNGILSNIASMCVKTGQYERALSLYEQAKNGLAETVGEKHPYFSITLNSLAALHRTMGNYEKALALYIKANEISLWQVSDASTSMIMQNFYAHLANGSDKAQALRQAKLDYIAEAKSFMAAHPTLWSPFILMGDAEPVDLAEKGGFAWSWYALGGGILLLGGLVLWRVWRREVA